MKIDKIDERISQYYDKELNLSTLLNYEAKLANSNILREYCNKTYCDFLKISQSFSMVKYRINKFKNKQNITFDKKKGLIRQFLCRFFEEFQ